MNLDYLNKCILKIKTQFCKKFAANRVGVSRTGTFSMGIFTNGVLMKGSPKPLGTTLLGCKMDFEGGLNWSPMMPREATLRDGCTPHRCKNSHLMARSSVLKNIDKPV